MELQSSEPKLHTHGKELVLPVSGQELVSDVQSLHRNMKEISSDGDRGGIRHPSPGVQEDQGHGDVDSDLFSRGWSKTGKRVGNSRARVKIPGFSQDDQEASRLGDEADQLPGKQKLLLKKRKMSESPVSDTGDGPFSLSGSRVMEPGEPENDDLADPGAEIAVESVNSDHNLTESRNEHVCDVCYRSFKSYQALGGHKAHHNADQDISFTEEKNGSIRRPGRSNQVHQCTLCKRIFSKGQALGGHKRHCQGLASHGGGLETENQPRILDFDLNELPPEWISEE